MSETAFEQPMGVGTVGSEEKQDQAVNLEQNRRPQNIPEQFWDEERDQIRTDALLESYLALEQRVVSSAGHDRPQGPADYKIEVRSELFSSDMDINTRLHEAGFSQEQAQLVYDLAHERLAPLVHEIASVFEAEHQVHRLKQRFGGDERWRDASQQISAWGRANLPAEVFDALSTSYDGVVVLHQMMSSNEPGLVRDGATGGNNRSENDLKQMMRDPRYWRDQDASFVNEVRDGVRKLFPQRG